MTAIFIVALFVGIFAAVVAISRFGIAPLLVGAMAILVSLTASAAHAGALGDFMTAAAPGVVELIGLALTGIIGWAATRARAKWGIEIEARHREALQSALLNGARLAMDRQLTGKAAIDLVLTFIRASVPDAIGNLKASPEVLTDLARAKLEQAAAEKARDVTGAAVDKLADALRKATGR